jgi:hypothetical protein
MRAWTMAPVAPSDPSHLSELSASVPPAAWTQAGAGPERYSAAHFAHSKVFVFRQWCDLAAWRGVPEPSDLSGACKYGSLFMWRLFGGTIRGHWQHQFNHIDGRQVDLSHDAFDVGAMVRPYDHEPLYFDMPESRAALQACLPRVDDWVQRYRQAG